jgi:hypothetical protein
MESGRSAPSKHTEHYRNRTLYRVGKRHGKSGSEHGEIFTVCGHTVDHTRQRTPR